ncbi:SCNM1 protein, partial [Irena cyanogastra]|nr:SCNM1 protein [Irena cyanogastra]
MSFKRDESDPGPLGALQRRRVAELLASAIPEDEALLLRDGRLACSLCPQRPVCDTLQTLLLHRAGRKHLDKKAHQGKPGTKGKSRERRRTGEKPRNSQQREFFGVHPLPFHPPGPRAAAPGPGSPGRPQKTPRRRRSRRGAPGAAGIPTAPAPRTRRVRPRPSRAFSREFPVPGAPSSALLAPAGAPKERKRRKGSSRCPGAPEGPSPERLRILRHHLHLRSRGWLQDPAGNWVKDAKAEFDSDEEEPPPLPP